MSEHFVISYFNLDTQLIVLGSVHYMCLGLRHIDISRRIPLSNHCVLSSSSCSSLPCIRALLFHQRSWDGPSSGNTYIHFLFLRVKLYRMLKQMALS
jgi:hypothetical protein